MSDSFWFVQTVHVETYTGPGSYGDGWAAPAPVACWLEDGSKMVRDAEGSEVVSTSAIYVDPADANALIPGSRVTLPSGRVARVLRLDRFESGSLGFGIDHAVANIT